MNVSNVSGPRTAATAHARVETREALVIRRRQADATRTLHEVTVTVTDRRHTAKGLEVVLHNMQRERGKGFWSNADPEVLVGASLVGRLRQGETIEELVNHVVERVFQDD